MLYAFGDSITLGFNSTDFGRLAYVPTVARGIGLPYVNYGGYGGSLFYDATTAILPKMLALAPPPRHDLIVTILGTNDIAGNGADLPSLELFKAGLTRGLLHLTSRRRVPDPKTDADRLLLRRGRRLPSVPDGCRVFVGNTPKQSIPYAFSGSPEAQALYAAGIASVVAAVAAQGRRVYLVDVASAYDPDTMSDDGPSHVHPADSGHAAIAAAFLAQIRAHP